MIDFPNSPTVGQVTTTPGGISWRWDGTTWLMVGGGSSGASGLVGYNDGFSQAVTTGTTEGALMVGPQPTFDAPGGRRYKITFTFTGAPNVAADMFLFKIRRGNGIAGAIVWTGPSDVVTVGNSPYNIVAYDTPPAGATQYTLTVVRQSGTGTFTMHGSINYGNFVSVEDVTFQPGASGSGGSGGGGGSGFTYVQDTKPTAAKQGDTWFNTATTAGGGSSLVAVNETPGNTSSELVWVQFSPTTQAPPQPYYIMMYGITGNPPINNNGTIANFTDENARKGITRSGTKFVVPDAAGAGIYHVSSWAKFWPMTAWPAPGTGYYAMWISKNTQYTITQLEGMWDASQRVQIVHVSGQVIMNAGDWLEMNMRVDPLSSGCAFYGPAGFEMTRISGF